MELKPTKQTINLKQVDWKDSRFRTSFFYTFDSLKRSISEVGILNPPLLRKTDKDKYRIICGFRRLTVLQELRIDFFDALIVDGKIPDIQLMELALYENLSVRDFNILEKAHIISNLKANYKIPQHILLKDYLPLLNLGNNPRWLIWSKQLIEFPQFIQSSFAQDKMSFDMIDFLFKLTTAEQENLISLVLMLQLSKNRQKDLILLLSDILRQKKLSLNDFLSKPELSAIIGEKSITPSQKTGRLFNYLKVQRYPEYSKTEKKFQDLVRSFKLTDKIQLHHTPYFEDDRFTIKIQFRNRDEFKQAVEIQQQLEQNNTITKLFDLVKNSI